MVERGNRPPTAEELAIAVEEEGLVAALREAVRVLRHHLP